MSKGTVPQLHPWDKHEENWSNVSLSHSRAVPLSLQTGAVWAGKSYWVGESLGKNHLSVLAMKAITLCVMIIYASYCQYKPVV